MFFMMVVKTFAQPSAAAPTPPTRSSSDVLSIFSDAYDEYPGTDFNPYWNQSTAVTTENISGNPTLHYSTLNYQGVDMFGAVDVANMQNLHFDVWTDNASALEAFLINEGIGEQGISITPTINGWKSVDISLAGYTNIALNNVGQLKFVGTPFGTSNVYLDNIYFWKSANAPTISNFSIPEKVMGAAPFSLTAPTSNSSGSFTYTSSNTSVATISGSTVTIVGVGNTIITATQAASGSYSSGSTSATLSVELGTAAPTPPVRSASNVISLFSNAYTNVTVDRWSTDWDGAEETDITISSNTTKKYYPITYTVAEFTSATVNATNMEKFHIDMYTPNATVFKIKLVDFGPNDSYGGGDDVEHELGYTPAKNQWVSYDINLSDFTGLVTKGHLAQLILVAEGTSPIVYIDNVYFWRASPAPTFGTFTVPAKTVGASAFTLTAPSSNSTGTFSYTSSDPNVATISGNTVTIIGAGTSVITATQTAAGAYGSGSTTANLVVTGPSAPTTGAPTPPVRVATDVISLFSGAYTNLSGTDWFPWWWQNAVAEDTTIAGNLAHKYPNLNYHGVQFAGNVDASGMSKLHFDIWTANCETFDFYLINPGPTERKVSINPPFAGWQSYDIALSEFSNQGIDLTSIGQFKFVSTPFGGTTVYMDNIYFWKPAGGPSYGTFSIPTKTVGDAKFKITAPTSTSSMPITYTSSNTSVATISNDSITIVGAGTSTITASQASGSGYLAGSISATLTVNFAPPAVAAPIPPARATGDVISLFSNSYANVPVDTWSATWDQANVADIQIGGNSTKKYTNLAFSGIEFTSTTVNATAMTNYHIDIWTPDATTFKIKLVDFGANGSYGGGDDTESAELTYTPSLGGWVSYDIPMSSFTGLAARAHLAQMILVASNSTVYVDNVYFWKGTASSPSISITQPTCSVTTGTVTVVSPVSGSTYSKDNGVTFSSTTGVFTGLAVGSYKIRSKTSSGVISDSVVATILTTTPTAPGTITGNINISQCDTLQTYSVSPIEGLTYSWSVTGTGNYVKSGQGNSSAVLVMKAAGVVSVKAAKCGTTYGAVSSLTVTAAAPAAPTTFTSTGTNICLYTSTYVAYSGVKDTFRIKKTAGATGYYFDASSGSTVQRLNDTTITVVFPDTATVAKVNAYNLSLCDTSLAKSITLTRTLVAAPASITVQAKSIDSCGKKRYRYIAPVLPAGATGYIWSFEGALYSTATIDSGSLTSKIVVIKYTNNAASAAGDTVRLRYTTGCGNSAIKSLKLTNTLLAPPAVPASITITKIADSACGKPRYRYTAPTLPVASSTTMAATGYLWSFVGTLGSAAVVDSGSLTSQTFTVRFNSTAVAGTDSVKVLYTSSCGNSLAKAAKLTNVASSSNVPLAPASITIALVSNTCGARVYRYTAPTLPVATTTASAATGYLWAMPIGTLGATANLDSGSLSGRVIRIRYSSNGAAATGDSIKLRYTSLCGNSLPKAQKLSNVALLGCKSIAPIGKAFATNAVEKTMISPNPNNGNFKVVINTGIQANATATIQIVNMNGVVVSQLKAVNNNGVINTEIHDNRLVNGLYMVRYNIGGVSNSIKMMVQK